MNSYKDSGYNALDQQVTDTLGLPQGLLSSIRLNGEKSNADQVSSAGAKTVYQVTPTTRALVLKKYGVDAYDKDPKNAALAAGYLLKEGLERNNGSQSQAVGEYIGGTNRENWGKTTKQYIARVVTGLKNIDSKLNDGTTDIKNAYDSLTLTPKESAPDLSSIFKAYKDGKMTAKDASSFESDVNAGKIMLPVGAQLKEGAAVKSAPIVNAQVVAARNQGLMSPEDAAAFDADIQSGKIALPNGAVYTPPAQQEAQPDNLLGDIGQGVTKFGKAAWNDGNIVTGIPKAAYGIVEAGVGGAAHLAATAPEGVYGFASGISNMLPRAIGGGGGGFGGFGEGYTQGSQQVQNLAEKIIPAPITQAGAATQQIMGAPGAELHRGGQGAGAWVEDKTGSKVAGGLAASLFETAGNAAMMGLPLKGKGAREIAAAERTRQQITANPPKQFTQPIQAAERPTVQQAALATTPEGLVAQAETMSAPVVEVGKPAVHVSNGVETPVVVKNIEQAISDGKTYARVEHEGGVSVVPVEELSPVSKLTPETPISVAAEQAATVAPSEAVSAPTGAVEVGQPAVWRSEGTDTPVVVKNIEQQAGSDGKTYARVEINGKDSFIPADELVATIDSTKPIEPMTNATTVNVPKASELPLQELASTARTSTEGIIGKKSARETLAEQASPSAPVVAAAERLGILDSLQPDHLTTNQSFRELSQAIKSYVGSPLRSAELEGLQQVATRADKIITDLGADKDVSSLSQKVKTEMQSTIDDLQSHARTMYDGLRDKVPPTDLVTAPKTLDFIQQRATNLGGETYLSPIEKTVLARLSDKSKPTYARLDDVRRDLTAAKYKNQGAFKDADSYLIDQIESTLKEDQRSALGEIAKRNGLDPAAMIADFDLAQKTAAAYKGMQSRMITLFGKQLDGNIARSLKNAVNGLSIGDTKSFVNIINSIPENMRGEAVANGLAYAFERNAGAINHNTFSNFWNGIKRQGEANKLLKQYLPPESYNALNDLGIVSESISKASKERIVTGRLNVVNETLKEADTWIGKLYEKAKAGAGQAAGAEAISLTMGAPGAGIAIGAVMAVLKDKPPIHLAIDKLLGSKEFRDAVATKSKMEALRGQK